MVVNFETINRSLRLMLFSYGGSIGTQNDKNARTRNNI